MEHVTEWNNPTYYKLRSNLQILRSALLDDRTSHAGDLKSDSVLSRGSIISKQPHYLNVYMLHVHYNIYLCDKVI